MEGAATAEERTGEKRMQFSRAKYNSSNKAVMPTAQRQDGGGPARKHF